MNFSLSESGTINKCREALNAAVHAGGRATDEEEMAVRQVAHHAAVAVLDSAQQEWERRVRFAKSEGQPEPPEPTGSLSVTINVSGTFN